MKDQDDIAKNLNLMLSTLKLNKALPKLIIYNLELSQNYLVACTLANFSSNLEHKVQLHMVLVGGSTILKKECYDTIKSIS